MNRNFQNLQKKKKKCNEMSRSFAWENEEKTAKNSMDELGRDDLIKFLY